MRKTKNARDGITQVEQLRRSGIPATKAFIPYIHAYMGDTMALLECTRCRAEMVVPLERWMVEEAAFTQVHQHGFTLKEIEEMLQDCQQRERSLLKQKQAEGESAALDSIRIGLENTTAAISDLKCLLESTSAQLRRSAFSKLTSSWIALTFAALTAGGGVVALFSLLLSHMQRGSAIQAGIAIACGATLPFFVFEFRRCRRQFSSDLKELGWLK